MNTDMAPARPASRDVGALLRRADQQAQSAAGLPALLRQRLAPDDGQTLREDDISLVGGFAHAIARQLLDALCPGIDTIDPDSVVHEVVLANGPLCLLLFSRAIEARLCRNTALIGLAMPELPPRIEAEVADSQDELAEAAMALIIAQSRFIGNAQGFYIELAELPPEILSMLVRQMLIWAQQTVQADPLALRSAADGLLASFDERHGRPHRLMRLCHLFALPRAGDDWSLAENGPSLVFAMLARTSGLPIDHLMDMMRDPDLTRLAIVLRGCDIDAGTAARLLDQLGLLASLPLTESVSANALAGIAPDDAARMLAGWRNLLAPAAHGAIW
jgi:hypothetical protein